METFAQRKNCLATKNPKPTKIKRLKRRRKKKAITWGKARRWFLPSCTRMKILVLCCFLVVGAGLPPLVTAARRVLKPVMWSMASPGTRSRSGGDAGVQLQNGSVGNACLPSSKHRAWRTMQRKKESNGAFNPLEAKTQPSRGWQLKETAP